MLAKVSSKRKEKAKVKMQPVQETSEEFHEEEAREETKREPEPSKKYDEVQTIMNSGMSLRELLDLQESISRQIEMHRSKILNEVQALAQHGLNLFEPQKRKRRYSTGKVYVNPDDPSKTWVGFGRRPFWIQERLDRGEDIEKLLKR